MCYECQRAKDWLAPPRSVRAELAFQSARLGGGAVECQRCLELGAELQALQDELRCCEEDEQHYYDGDRDPDVEPV